MKKCMIMFALLLMTLIVAVLTERNQEIATMENLAMEAKISDDIVFEQATADQNVSKEENNRQMHIRNGR